MTIRVGVVGAGFIGADHLAAYASWPDAEIVGVADADPVAGGRGGGPLRGGTPTLTSRRSSRPAVSTPSACASRPGSTCRSSGWPPRPASTCLLEKPMAATVAECDEIAAACRSAGVTLMLGFTHRFHPELVRARELIAAGRLGPIGLAHDHFSFGEDGPWPAWYYARELSGGGELMHDAVHLVDRLAWLVGSPIVEVVRRRRRPTPGGSSGSRTAGSRSSASRAGRSARCSSTESTLPLHRDAPSVPMPGRLELELHGPRGSLRYRTWQALEFDGDGGESWTIEDAPRDELRLEIREFLDAIAEGRPPSVGAAEGRRGIAVIGAIYESERIGRPVRVDELFPEPAPRVSRPGGAGRSGAPTGRARGGARPLVRERAPRRDGRGDPPRAPRGTGR